MAGQENHFTLPRPFFDKPVKLLIVVAPYYRDVADNLIDGAKAEIEAAARLANIHDYRVFASATAS